MCNMFVLLQTFTDRFSYITRNFTYQWWVQRRSPAYRSSWPCGWIPEETWIHSSICLSWANSPAATYVWGLRDASCQSWEWKILGYINRLGLKNWVCTHLHLRTYVILVIPGTNWIMNWLCEINFELIGNKWSVWYTYSLLMTGI